MTDQKAKATAKAIEEAWAYWLNDHPVSVPEIIEDAIKKAYLEFLNANRGEIIAAIAKEARHG
ncbi:hypothetical protein [Sphingomonas sp.]|uniref:hypothetical protein n=1 Tax=Sphingomonas sp. TaxID=28214 RepID=UPI0025FFC154|nr:hypothetical protein [Sphingomonas sp.]